MEVATRDGTTRRRCRMVGSRACAHAARRTPVRAYERKPDARVTAPRILTHADRDQRGARGAAPGGARVGGTALRPRGPAVGAGRRDGVAPAVLGRSGGARLAGIARRRGPRRRGLRPARAGGGARGAGAGVRAGPVPAHGAHGGCAAGSRQGDRRRHRARAGVGRDRRDGRAGRAAGRRAGRRRAAACAARSGPCPLRTWRACSSLEPGTSGARWSRASSRPPSSRAWTRRDVSPRCTSRAPSCRARAGWTAWKRRGCGIWRRRCSRPRVWAWRSGASRPRPSTPRCGSSSVGPSASSRV